MERKALGRGLSALIPELPKRPAAVSETEGATENGFFFCDLKEVAASPENPRREYDETKLTELADSIKTQGLIQPLVVRPAVAEDHALHPVRFILIAGERRWRAAQRAGLKEVPVVIKDVSPNQAFELALVENLQRQDLNALEEAEAYRKLSDEFGYTQDQLAQRVGKARETIANALRLLKLPTPVQHMVVQEELTMGHARALLSISESSEMERLAKQVAEKQLSVRQTEELVRKVRRQAAEPIRFSSKSAALRALEERMENALGLRVKIMQKNSQSGTVEISYRLREELERLLKRVVNS